MRRPRVFRLIAPAASCALLCAAPAAAGQVEPRPQPQVPRLSLEHSMLLRCSAAFALVANSQASGDAEALAWPLLEERGKEFFVRSAARVMDKAGLDREQIDAALKSEAQMLVASEQLDEIMPVCLGALDDSGL